MECVDTQRLHSDNPMEYRKKIMKLLFTFFSQKNKIEPYLLMYRFNTGVLTGPRVSHVPPMSSLEGRNFLILRRWQLPSPHSLCFHHLIALLPFPCTQLSGFIRYIILNDGMFTIPKKCQGSWTSIVCSLNIFC